MSSDKSEFEARLRRISEFREETSPPINTGGFRTPQNEPKSAPLTKRVLNYLVFALVLAGGATLVAARVSGVPRDVLREVSASLQGDGVAPAEPGLVDRLANLIFPSGDDTAHSPMDFLPPAPDGWLRVTPDEAALPNALDAIKARWPQGSDVLPVEQNLGFKQLTWYLDLRAEKDVESKVLSRTRTTAMYLSGTGDFLAVRLEFTSDRKPLGGQNDPASWIEGLAAIEEGSLESGEILERLTLSGIEVTNQTKAAGKSLVSRPIGSDIYAPNGFKIAAPLTSRAILRIEGLATPAVAQALITSVDRDALSASQE